MNQKHVNETLALLRQLPECDMFRYLRGLTAADVTVDTAEIADDALHCGAYAIQETIDLVKTISGSRTQPLFLVLEPRASGGGYWEPEDVDIVEFTRTSSFSDALREAILREAFHHIGNIQEANGLYASITEEN